MKTTLGVLLVCFALAGGTGHGQGVSAESAIAVQDKELLDRQAGDFYSQLDPQAKKWAASEVKISRGDYVVAHGVVVGPGRVLTKWSDLGLDRGPLIVRDSQGNLYDSRIMGGYAEHDLALLDVPTMKLPAVNFANAPVLSEGDFLFSVRLDGRAGEFGVVSVAERSLRGKDQPYLGIIIDPAYEGGGVLVTEMQENSPAIKAGIVPGDVILQLGNKPLSGGISLRTALAAYKPGDGAKLVVRRGGKDYATQLELTNRPVFPTYPQERLEAMNAMGNRLSYRREDFPAVIQTDMKVSPENTGRLVLNLEGQPVGISLSRAGRIESYVLPAHVIERLLKESPSLPASRLPQSRNVAQRQEGKQGRLARRAQGQARLSPEELQALETMQLLEQAMRQTRNRR